MSFRGGGHDGAPARPDLLDEAVHIKIWLLAAEIARASEGLGALRRCVRHSRNHWARVLSVWDRWITLPFPKRVLNLRQPPSRPDPGVRFIEARRLMKSCIGSEPAPTARQKSHSCGERPPS